MFKYGVKNPFYQHHERIQNLHNPSDDSENLLDHSWRGYFLNYHLPPDKVMLVGGKPQRPHYKQCRKYDWPMEMIPLLPLQIFEILYNFIFKILCIFLLWYLFAINLQPIFSFRNNLPPALSINPKMLYSLWVYVGVCMFQERTGVSTYQNIFSKVLGFVPRPTTLL